MTLRYTLIAIAITTLIGCSANGNGNYASQAIDNRTQTLQRLIEEVSGNTTSKLNASNRSISPPEVLLTDLLSVPALTNYLDAALKNSPSLQQSVIALKIAYAQHGVTSSERLPSVNAGFDAQNEEQSDESYSADVSISWELDIWQRIADSSAAAIKDIEASQASLNAAKNLLTANIMRGWLEIHVNQQLLDIERRRLDILAQNESLVLERYQAGLGSLEELDNAKSNTAAARATVAQYQENLLQSKRSLTLLTGQWQPQNDTPLIDNESEFPLVLNPLEAVPVQTLAGRPDLQQAFHNIEAESLRTDAAYKAMLPSFSLSASLTDMAQTPSEALFTNPLWSVLGQMSAPLFQGGKLKSQAEIAQLTTEQSFWAYQETLLTAINEVENAIGQENALTLQQSHLDDAFLSAQRSIVSYEQKYRQGLVDILDLLTVQQQAYDIEAQLTNTTYQRLLNRIELGLALGLGVSA
ncbi:TolC family protein [Shewanella gelidii]|uniref:Outer membrane protein OprM n=1 Tax=Shewanella gelidii TaxID=1642821 RepID=A0A917NBE8_9GAMM|nr:TolC family protein [Shewanella gelidii]MCL1098033.1 TolC family protein [Shewanella gelidii]GGI85592.1 outer membrane protein OprM [Shewanella gelidii]